MREGPVGAGDGLATGVGGQPLVARQPVFDPANRVMGYELLYRGAPPAAGEHADWSEQATSSVLLDLIAGGGLDGLLGEQTAFVNLPRSFLLDFRQGGLDPSRLVLEVLEDVDPDPEVKRAMRALKDDGYTLALDDFVLFGQHQGLLELADLVKVDIQGYDDQGLRECVRELRRYPLYLVAEKVETHAEQALCRELGFDYFQGYFFAQPRAVARAPMPSDRLTALRLLGRLQDPAVDLEDLTDLISQDVYLSYRFLRLINSAFFPLRRRIDSIHRALVYLGLDTVRIWATWLAMAGIGGKPRELAVTNLVRARMAASLGRALGDPEPERYFTAGLFSTLDALLDRPLREALEELPLSEELMTALLYGEGPVGETLAAVRAYERADWQGTAHLGLALEQVGEAYLEAVQWAEEARAAMDAGS